jgi:3-methyladenine DNA glycosylase AlkD
MTFDEVLKKLKSSGTEKNRLKLQTFGAGDKIFGVSESHLNKLKEKIGKDHDLGVQLWNSRYIEAQLLAIMIMDPAGISEKEFDPMVSQITYYTVADAFVNHIVINGSSAIPKMKAWIKSGHEYTKRCGYLLLESLAETDHTITNEEWLEFIYTIEREMSTSPNRAREAMNRALIAMGKRNKLLNMEALIIGMRMGYIIIEHGGKEIKAPYAMDILGEKKLKQTFPE